MGMYTYLHIIYIYIYIYMHTYTHQYTHGSIPIPDEVASPRSDGNASDSDFSSVCIHIYTYIYIRLPSCIFPIHMHKACEKLSFALLHTWSCTYRHVCHRVYIHNTCMCTHILKLFCCACVRMRTSKTQTPIRCADQQRLHAIYRRLQIRRSVNVYICKRMYARVCRRADQQRHHVIHQRLQI
jgi:hypothetical protein